jgi:hypothetical protein
MNRRFQLQAVAQHLELLVCAFRLLNTATMKLQVIAVAVLALGYGLYITRDEPIVKQALNDFNTKITKPMGMLAVNEPWIVHIALACPSIQSCHVA